MFDRISIESTVTGYGVDDNMICLQNDSILLELDPQSGAVTRLHTKRFARDLLSGVAPPARLVRNVTFEDVEVVPDVDIHHDRVELKWSVGDDVAVAATIRLGGGAESGVVTFHAAVENRGESAIRGVEYPVLPIDRGDATDELAHAYATGFLIRDPYAAFPEPGDGLRLMPYPEGFAGATAQLCAYYRPGHSGFSISCLDPAFYAKWINVYRGSEGMEATVIHGAEDLSPGNSFRTTYETHLRVLGPDGWYAAAEHYKSWAVRQQWCEGGWTVDRDPESSARRLLDRVGAATFGLDSRHDRSRWVRAYQRDVGTPLLHVIGPDWTRIPRGYARQPAPGPLDEVFPAQISSETVKVARENRDLIVPFEFDLFFPPEKAEGAIRESYQHIPEETLSHGQYRFPFLCPTCDAARELHIERDRRLVAEEDVDGVYYDISANNVIRTCERGDHDHPPGAAAALTRAYRTLYAETREAMAKERDAAPLIGTEMVNEVFVDQTDFYQTRAGGQPAAAFEGGPIRELIKTGQAELIPMFSFLYHEYGPVRLDGWGKLVEEAGDLFYWLAARIYAWGGLYEINAEFSPSEVIDGVENDPDEHYADIVPRGYAYVPERAEYIGRWAQLRLGDGRDFLVYGRMLRPPEIAVLEGPATAALDWFGYNCPSEWREYEDRGTLTVQSVVASAWESRNGARACVLCNVTDVPVRVAVALAPHRTQSIYLQPRQPLIAHVQEAQ